MRDMKLFIDGGLCRENDIAMVNHIFMKGYQMALVKGVFPCISDDPTLAAIRHLKFLDIQNGPWVAGGCVRRLLTTMPSKDRLRDVDVFFPQGSWSKDTIMKIIENKPPLKEFVDTSEIGELKKKFSASYQAISSIAGYTKTWNTYLGCTVTEHDIHDWLIDGTKVQAVFGQRFDNVQTLFNDFDFTVCMVATDGFRWVADERFFRDDLAKRLVLNNYQQRRKGLGRLARYCSYGYTPIPGVLTSMLSLDTSEMLTNMTDKGFLPGDGNAS